MKTPVEKPDKTTYELYRELEELIAEFTDEDVPKVRRALDRLFDTSRKEP